jgi:hypothetical protein
MPLSTMFRASRPSTSGTTFCSRASTAARASADPSPTIEHGVEHVGRSIDGLVSLEHRQALGAEPCDRQPDPVAFRASRRHVFEPDLEIRDGQGEGGASLTRQV